jgi:hypothetical protein
VLVDADVETQVRNARELMQCFSSPCSGETSELVAKPSHVATRYSMIYHGVDDVKRGPNVSVRSSCALADAFAGSLLQLS